MVSEMMVDRVIGTKRCLKCGAMVSCEGYTIPEVNSRLLNEQYCQKMHATPDGTPLEYYKCNADSFTDPKFEVKMKQSRPWIKEALKRMR